MAIAEIISIGTELLLGEILDSNAQHIAKKLREVGIDLYWVSTVGDNQVRIAQAIQSGLSRADILICTGGLGPTIDDMSREGIAKGLNLELEYQEDLWEEIKRRFAKFGREASENNKKQAFVPLGAQVIDNPNGSAPAFLVEQNDKVVISMPGVPQEMIHILEASVLPYFKKRYRDEGMIVSRILHTAGIGESLIDERIADLEKQQNPSVGLAAHLGAVDIRLTAKAGDKALADQMLDELEAQIRDRLGDWIYGVDGQSQANAIEQELSRLGWKISGIQFGLEDHLSKILAAIKDGRGQVQQLTMQMKLNDIHKQAKELALEDSVGLAAQLLRQTENSQLRFSIISPNDEKQYHFSYGGQIDGGPEWASKIVADHLRRFLADQ